MKFEKDTSGISRYVAFDTFGKEYALVGGQNAQQEWVMAPRRVASREETLARMEELGLTC